MNETILNKSISELEKWKWNEDIPSADDSFVVRNFYRLHNIPIADYLLADIRFMIGQNTGLEFLVPIALNELQKNIFIEADLYPGDLLCSLFLINEEPNFWLSHEKEKQELINLYNEQKKMLGTLDVSEDIKVKIKEAYKEFTK
jgi:hypothetical protein